MSIILIISAANVIYYLPLYKILPSFKLNEVLSIQFQKHFSCAHEWRFQHYKICRYIDMFLKTKLRRR